MSVWRDSDGNFESYTLVPRSVVRRGVVGAFADALLGVWAEAAREGEQLDLRTALERLRDEHASPEEMMDEYNRRMARYDEALDHWKTMLERHNRVVDQINRLRRRQKDMGLFGNDWDRLDEAEEALPQARERLAEAEERLDEAIENAARLGQEIRQTMIAVAVEPGSPNLRRPTDPRRTDDRVAEVRPIPKEPDVGSTRVQGA